ncbi:MAG: hypothetical protein NTU53_16525, partial [Planctomycetota bacterium]|nr:hypothetical protein [Planctomycetota bacterium]
MFTVKIHQRAWKLRSRRLARALRPCVAEVLEQRVLLATVSWDGSGDGASWNDPLNWSGDALPEAGDDVIVNVADNPTIRFTSAAGTVNIKSLATDETMNLSGGVLAVADAATIQAAMILAGGTLKGGTLNGTGVKLIGTASGGTLDGVTVNCDVELAGNNANLTVKN